MSSNSLLCVGLDPDLQRIPDGLGQGNQRIFGFNRLIIDATAEYACAFKPQIAHYSAVGAEKELAQTIDYIRQHYPDIPVILDAKRGDIGSTAARYAEEAFGRYNAHAVTVNPYLGGDTLAPFLEFEDRGVIILCRTSNPGSGDLQSLDVGGKSVSELVAQMATEKWNRNNNISLVVGATYPEELAQIRGLVGDMTLLVPGIGAQGGDLKRVLRAGLLENGLGLVINSSRAILYAGSGSGFEIAAARHAANTVDEINQIRVTLQ